MTFSFPWHHLTIPALLICGLARNASAQSTTLDLAPQPSLTATLNQSPYGGIIETSGTANVGDAVRNTPTQAVWGYDLAGRVPSGATITGARLAVTQQLSGGITGAPYGAAGLGRLRLESAGNPHALTISTIASGVPILFADATKSNATVDVTSIVSAQWAHSTRIEVRARFEKGTDGDGRVDAVTLQPGILRVTYEPVSPAVPSATTNPDAGRIVFVSTRDGSTQIYVMRADGSDVRMLTQETGFNPAWSPDKKTIAFSSARSGNEELYLMNADGSNQRRITNMGARTQTAGDVAWSPDGKKLVFVSYVSATQNSLYTINPDGTGLAQVTRGNFIDGGPSWSHGGGKIAFTSNRAGNREIYVINPDGTGLRRVTFSTVAGYVYASSFTPNWSPAGALVFASDRGPTNGYTQLYTINLDGTGERRLTNLTDVIGHPDYTFDGKAIVFSRFDGLTNNAEIWQVDLSGGNPVRLTNNPAYDDFPDCGTGYAPQPTSAINGRIAFESRRDGNGEIYIMDADGSHQTRLTNNPAYESLPSFTPDGSKILFHSNRGGIDACYSMNLDGSNVSRLSILPANSWYPAYSRDGSRLVFLMMSPQTSQIYVMNADGTGLKHLPTPNAALYPSFSPDGRRITFTMRGVYDPEIYVMNADGTNLQPLSIKGHSRLSTLDAPVWSPDGSKLAVRAGFTITVINVDGSGQTTLSALNAEDYAAAWSPDGRSLVITSVIPAPTGRNWDIFQVNLDGTRRRLTTSAAIDQEPVWVALPASTPTP